MRDISSIGHGMQFSMDFGDDGDHLNIDNGGEQMGDPESSMALG